MSNPPNPFFHAAYEEDLPSEEEHDQRPGLLCLPAPRWGQLFKAQLTPKESLEVRQRSGCGRTSLSGSGGRSSWRRTIKLTPPPSARFVKGIRASSLAKNQMCSFRLHSICVHCNAGASVCPTSRGGGVNVTVCVAAQVLSAKEAKDLVERMREDEEKRKKKYQQQLDLQNSPYKPECAFLQIKSVGSHFSENYHF